MHSLKIQFLNSVSFIILKEKSHLTNLQSVIILLLISHDLKKQLSTNKLVHIVPSKSLFEKSELFISQFLKITTIKK